MKSYILVFLLILPSILFSQANGTSIQAQAYAEAERQGLDPKELEQRLIEKGINTAELSMDDLPTIQPIVAMEIAKMKSEKTLTDLPSVELAATESYAAVNIGPEVKSPIKKNISSGDDKSAVFGRHIFNNGSIEVFEVSKDYVPSNAYILGPGDVLTVSIFGRSQADLQFTIKPDGFIEPMDLPKVYLKGVNLGQARELVESRFKNFYQFEKGQFALTLTTSRTITVQITGAVSQPGTYTLSAYNTAFNALMASGGPNEIGTVRNIQVINGRKKRVLDVYKYLFNPSNQKDYYLQNNDILYVPFVGDVVSVEGAVKQSGLFEMKKDENFDELLKYAGGYLFDALEDEFQLVRRDNEGSFVKEFKGSELDIVSFKDGDRIIVTRQTSDRKDYISVKGAVNYPGIYGVRDYGDLKTLLDKVDLKENTRMDVAYIIRSSNNGTTTVMDFSPNEILNGQSNYALQAEDVIQILNLKDFVDGSRIKVSGAVRDTGHYAIDSNLTVDVLVKLSNGLSENAKKDFAYVFRSLPDGLKQVFSVALDDISFEFQHNDELRILSENNYLRDATITVSGEVSFPMELPFDNAITLKELVTLCGGLTLAGDSNKLMVYRMSFNGASTGQLSEYPASLSADATFRFKPYDVVVVRRKENYRAQEFATISGEVAFPGKYAISEDLTLGDLIAKAGGLNNNSFLDAAKFERVGKGVLAVNIKKELRSRKTNMFVLAGDKLFIPKKDLTVSIRYANTQADQIQALLEDDDLASSFSTSYVPGHNARWYINNIAGGFGENAKKTKVLVIGANGTAVGYKFIRLWNQFPKVGPGSTIVIPTKTVAEKTKREDRDWESFAQNLIAQVTSVLTVYTLATKL